MRLFHHLQLGSAFKGFFFGIFYLKASVKRKTNSDLTTCASSFRWLNQKNNQPSQPSVPQKIGAKPIISQKFWMAIINFQANRLFFFNLDVSVPRWFFSAMAGTLDNGFHGFCGGLRRKWHRRSGLGNPHRHREEGLDWYPWREWWVSRWLGCWLKVSCLLIV